MGAFNDFILCFSLAMFFIFFFFYYRYQHSHLNQIEIPEEALEEAFGDLAQQPSPFTLSTKFIQDSIPEGQFAPGSLNRTGEEVLRECFLEPGDSDQHRGKSQCVISDKHKLILFLVPKTGSSTNRIAFRDILDGTDGNKFCTQKISPKQRAYRTVVTVREPLSRFFSQYMEAEFRSGQSDNSKMAQFEWWSMEDKQERFLKFVDYWHENMPFREVLDTHFRLQAPMLSWYDGSVRRIDWFMPLENMNDAWAELKELLDIHDGKNEIKKARKNGKPSIDKSNVSDEYKRKICQIVAVDYCCMNYKLPEVCEGTVTCEYKKRLNTNSAARYIVPKLHDLKSLRT